MRPGPVNWEAYLREHGAPPPKPKPEYTPAVMKTDWEADKREVLRSAKVGMVILVALVVSVIGWAWSLVA